MTAISKPQERRFYARFEPDWGRIGEIRERCRDFCTELNYSADTRDAIGMVASELLENAVKYGNFQSESAIELHVDAANDSITLEVRSPLTKNEENMKRLDSFVQWIRGFQSPFQAYVERLRFVANQPMESDESGLGLVRIAYEGEALLDFYVSENDFLHVSAVFPLER